MEGMAQHEVSPTFTVDETHNLSTSTTKSQSVSPTVMRRQKKKRDFFPTWSTPCWVRQPSTRCSCVSWTSSCSAQLLLMASWEWWFPTKKLGLNVHKIAQNCTRSMNLSRGARVSMSSLIYDQTPLIKGKAIQFYHLLLGEPPNTPTTQWDPIRTHSNDIYKLSFFQQ